MMVSLIEPPDHYEIVGLHSCRPPFHTEFVKAGPQLGWIWTNCGFGGSCEAVWLDPEPNKESVDYLTYLDELEYIENDTGFYKGFHKPLTKEEHQEPCRDIPLDPMLARYSSSSCFGRW